MSLRATRLAMMSMAVAAALSAPADVYAPTSSAAEPPPQPKRGTVGNSGHMPHQGKREMERRRKRMKQEPRT